MKKLAVVLAWLCVGRVWAGEKPAASESRISEAVMNEFSGSVISVDSDARLLRIALDGGYNVEFTYDSKTAVSDGGRLIEASDLSYGDKVVARYVGKELLAKQIVRNGPVSGSAAPVEVVASTPTVAATAPSVVSSVSTPTPIP